MYFTYRYALPRPRSLGAEAAAGGIAMEAAKSAETGNRGVAKRMQ